MVSIIPEYLTFWKLVSGRLFRIPEYQRSYSWGTKQRQDLFSDIEKVFSKTDSMHFMAAIVGLRRSKKTIVTDDYYITEIVDGQQRLTTLIILLRAILVNLDEDNPVEEKIYNEISELLVKSDEDSLILLQTNHDSSHLFKDYLLGRNVIDHEAKTHADKQIIQAFVDCQDFVQTWLENNRSLTDLVTLIKNKLTFIFHEIDDESTVYTVFEVLNSRGLDVSWIDRLKSILMGMVYDLQTGNEEESIKDLKNIWTDLYKCVGLKQDISTEALKFTGTLHQYPCPNRILGEEASVNELRNSAKSLADINSIARLLLLVTEAVNELHNDPRRLAVTEIIQARFLAVSILLRNDLTKNQKDQLLQKWEKLSFRIYGLGRKDSRTGVGEFVRLGWEIFKGNINFSQIVDGLKAISKNYPILDNIDALIGLDAYNGWKEELRYFFYRYEDFLAKESGQKFTSKEWAKIWQKRADESIEHIWAQNNAPEDCIHSLGNLVMLPPKLNSQLQDTSAKKKISEYKKTGLLAAHEVAILVETGAWNKKAVKKREQKLLEWAVSEWAD